MTQHANDFAIEVSDIRHLTLEEPQRLTLLWLLQGHVELQTSESTAVLSEGDVAIINPGQREHLHSAQANTVMILRIASHWLTRLDAHFFAFDYRVAPPSSHGLAHDGKLRALMRQLLVTHLLNHETQSRLEANRWLGEMALLLATHFQHPSTQSVPYSDADWSQRIRQVVTRIESRYHERVSLAEIARAERVSEAWLSRLFHKEVGVSFMQYITALRLKKAEEQLLGSTHSLQRIAQEQGFASARVMSDLFKRRHGMTPRQYRLRPATAGKRTRHPEPISDDRHPVSAEILYTLLNRAEKLDWEEPSQPLHCSPLREIALHQPLRRRTALRQIPVVITLREIDDLLRDDVRRSLEALHAQIPIDGIDIHEPFLSSRLFSEGWDSPLTTECACWYPLQQVFTYLARMGWRVLLHTSMTTRPDLLRQFLRLSAQHFPAATLASWHFVWHWSPQASVASREKIWHQQKAIIHGASPDSLLGIWHRFSASLEATADDPIFQSAPLKEADFLACSANANECLQTQPLDRVRLAATEDYPVEKVGQIQRALRQHHLSLPVWLLSWNTLTGSTRRTNGDFFRGALLINTLLGVADQVALTGFWLNSSLQGEARSNGTFDTTSLALLYHHELPRPIYWVLWFWQRLKGDVVVNDKQTLLLHHRGRYQLLLRNPVVFNPWLSSEETFIQRFRQSCPLELVGLRGRWKIKRLQFDQHHGAIFPRLEAIESSSGPDEETWTWLAHTTRPALSVREVDMTENWQVLDALESNGLVLYELTPLN